jgi:MFS family permease
VLFPCESDPLALGLALSAEVTTLWQLVALYGVVMTVGANCLGLVVLTPLISRRFVERRGLVLSIVQSANGFGPAASALRSSDARVEAVVTD